jgi:hypothetical protein
MGLEIRLLRRIGLEELQGGLVLALERGEIRLLLRHRLLGHGVLRLLGWEAEDYRG